MKRLLFVTLFLLFITARLMAADYYWVKGTGIWSDPNHWATTSGGIINPMVVPTAYDDVHFDDKSFTGPNQVVTITYGGGIANVVCNSMDWTGALYNPMLIGNSSQTLRIYGSLTFIPAMTFSFSGIIYFEALASGNTVTSGGKTFQNNIVFQGTGSWMLQDSLTANATVQFRSGSLNTNGKKVQCKRFLSSEGNVRTLNITNSLVKIKDNTSGYSWDINGTGLTFNSVGSLIVIDGGDLRLSNTGTPLTYNDVKIFRGTNSTVAGGGSSFKVIQAGDALNIAPANMTLSAVHFADSIISYSTIGNTFSFDSVTYVQTTKNLTLNNSTHSGAGKVKIGQDATIQSNNRIDSLWVYGKANISQNNIIKCDSIFGDGAFGGATGLSNDFGRLIVKGNSTFLGINKVEHCLLQGNATFSGTNSIQYCLLQGNATFSNVNTFDSLYLTPRKMYQIKGKQTVTINKVLSLDGTCTDPIILRSIDPGVQGILHKSSGAVVGSFLSLQDIKAEGATFTANSSVDLGNNTGMTINKASWLSFYWIGGTGNWDEPSHWSSTSGGAPGTCLPTAIDDVYFDAKSFTAAGQTVTVNLENAVCHDMTWAKATNNPTFTGPGANNLRIYGSLTLNPVMTHSFTGPVYFEANTTGNTVTSWGKTFKNNVVFQGTGGGWTLQDSLTTTSTLKLWSGSLNLNQKTLGCSQFLSVDANDRSLDITNSTVKIKSGSWNVNGTKMLFTSAGSLIIIDGGTPNLNNSGAALIYNNVKIYRGATSTITGGGSSFNLIQAGDNLTDAPTNLTLSAVHFAESIISFSPTLNTFSYDLVNYIKTSKNLNIGNLSTQSYAKKVIIGLDAKIESNNKIDSLWIYGSATINKNNIIGCDSIFGNGTFSGALNDFGRLIVKGNSSFSGTNTVKYCVLQGNATFLNVNTFDSLYLAPRMMYQIGGGQTVTINKFIELNGLCTGPIILQSTVPGVQAILHKSLGSIVGEYLSLRDIKAEGAVPFTANRSVDLGNNPGWTITVESVSKAHYWVGGTGSWDDPNHWSLTSGGPGNAICPPTAFDDVYFDDKSFTAVGQTVSIDIGNAVCRNMTWAGAKYTPTFAGSGVNNLRVYGSLTFNPDMTYNFLGPVFFEATTTGNLVTSYGKSFKNNVVFQGIGGGWILQDSLTTTSVLQLLNGSLNTNQKTVGCKQFYSVAGNDRTLDITNSLVKIKDNTSGYSWDLNGTKLDFKSVGSRIVIDGVLDQKLQNTGTPLKYNNIKILRGTTSTILGGGSRFNLIQSGDALANAPASMTLSAVHYADSIVSYSSVGNTFSYDSVNYVKTSKNLVLSNTSIMSVAGKVIIGQDATIQSKNKIDSLWIYGNATISQNNIIRSDSIFGNGTFNGLTNDFGRLVVMGNSLFTGTNKVEHCVLRGNATFTNLNKFDSLYLSPGRIYQINAGDTVKINSEILIRGNNCHQIQLRSTVQGQKATLWKPDGDVSGDFFEVRDVWAVGGAAFYAGSYSTSLGNNNFGWIFKNTPGYVFGLGPDAEICIGEALSTFNFNGADSYVWQDGSTNPSFTIKKAGTYWVKANYGVGCAFSDTIVVTTKPSPDAHITIAPPLICKGSSVQLAGIGSGGALPYSYTYSWGPAAGLNDSYIINPVASPEKTTNYIFTATSWNGCSARDTLLVTVASPVEVSLITTDPIGCKSPTGTSTAIALGGKPFTKTFPYTYDWNTVPVKSSATVTGLIAGSYVVTATDSLGCTGWASAVLSDPGSPVVLLSLSTDTICGSTVAIAKASGATLYEFFVDGISQGKASSNAVLSLSGLAPGVYMISVTGNQTGCIGASEVLPLTVIDGVTADISFTVAPLGTFSPGQLLTFTANPVNGGSAPKYQWLMNGQPVIGATKQVFTFALANMDVVTCRMTSNAPCVTNPVVLSDPFMGSAPSITGPTTVFKGSCVVTYSTEANMTGYLWTVSSGGIKTAGATPNVIKVTWNTAGPQTVTVNYTTLNGLTAATPTVKKVTVNLLPVPTITGSVNACIDGSYTYSTEASMTGYKWTVSAGGTFKAGGDKTNTITITWNTVGAQSVSVNYINPNSCAVATSAIKSITVNPLPPTLIGLSSVCMGASGVIYTTEAAMISYIWNKSAGGTITAGAATNAITMTWNTLGTQNVSVNYINANGCTAKTAAKKDVVVNPLPSPTITGSATACIGVSYTYTTESAMTGYIWNVSAGGTITSVAGTNTITVIWSATGTQNVSVNYSNTYGCAAIVAQKKNVTVNPLPVPTITGQASVCAGTTGVTYTTEAAMSGYTWNVSSGGTMTTGATPNIINVIWNTAGAQTVSVNYSNANGCAAASATEKAVTVNPVPLPIITGLASVCVGTSGVAYTTEAAMSNYKWTVSSGGTMTAGATPNTITMVWNTAGVQTVSANYINANGCPALAATVQNVNVNPLPNPTISIAPNTWIGATYVYTTEPDMTNYNWIVSDGGIISAGAQTNSATVQWLTLGWQTLSVNYVNEFGCINPIPTVQKMKVIDPPFTKTEGFSPNGDGINDVLMFVGLRNYPKSKLVIFTRDGQTVYESEDYQNDWDGKFLSQSSKNGISVISGTYYYILKLGGTNRTVKGYIYIGY